MKFSSSQDFRLTALSLICSALILTFTAACDTGGGGGVFVTPEDADQGRFLDGPVEGLQYDSLTWTGLTGAEGTFNYKAGETITFSIGDVVLGSSTARDIITPIDLVPGAVNATHPVVINISQFLQSLDLDGDPGNGITITTVMREALQGFHVDFTDPDFDHNPDVQAMFATLNDLEIYPEDRLLISAEDAQLHLEETLTVIAEEALEAEEALKNMKLVAWIQSPSGHGILIQGQSFNLQGSVIGGTPPYSSVWDFGDGGNLFQGEDPGDMSFNTPGTYTVLFSTADASGETARDFRLITVIEPSSYGPIPSRDEPVVVFIRTPGGLSVPAGGSLHLPAEILKGNPPFRYSWGYDASIRYAWQGTPLDANFIFTAPGSHVISVSFRDSSGDQWYDSVTVEVGGTLP